MASYIGIDLGTTYSAVATLDATGRPIILNNCGKNITASCVMLENDQLIVGDRPEAQFGQMGFEVGARFKRYMGEEWRTTLGSKKFTPTDLSAAVLMEMKKIAEGEIGEIAEAVVTIPANFMQEARDATMLAAKKAGLNVKFIINEPTAAALYYGYKENAALNGHYVVYDLGGGTFDVSVIDVSGESVEVKATEGVSKLGGDDFDKAIREILKNKFKVEFGKNASDEDLPLSEMAKRKIDLSERQMTRHLIQGEIVEVTRAEFEEAISGLISQTELLCESVLDEAGLTISDIQSVFLAGGSTRIPAVNKSIQKVFLQEPIASANVDEVVALGAALYAAMKSTGDHLSATQTAAISKLSVSEIATYFFGTLSVNYNQARGSEEMQNSIIINKGERIPCSQKMEFLTRHDNQTAINCSVTKSGSPESDPRFVSVVWEGELELPDGRPSGQEVEVTYLFDENGMMKCSFLDKESGRKTEVDLDSLAQEATVSEIDQFLVD